MMAAKTKLKILKDDSKGLSKLKRVLKNSDKVVYVGILSKDGTNAHPSKDENGLTLLDVAIRNEFGYRKNGKKIPRRSFLRDWVAQKRKEIQARLVGEAKKMVAQAGLTGLTPAHIKAVLERTGLWAQGSIQQRISNRIPPPNAPYTIWKKGSDVPLIDTGQLRSSISYKVEKK